MDMSQLSSLISVATMIDFVHAPCSSHTNLYILTCWTRSCTLCWLRRLSIHGASTIGAERIIGIRTHLKFDGIESESCLVEC